jgi:3-phosphoinositide dependent protein kinase-1
MLHTTTNNNNNNTDEAAEDSVDDLRQKGNYEFQNGNLDHAILFYTAAIEKSSDSNANANANDSANTAAVSVVVINLCNRSACYYQLEDYEQAKQDAYDAWEQSGHTNVKAAYRLSKTYMALHDYDKAMDVVVFALTSTSLSLSLSATEKQSLDDLQTQIVVRAKKNANNAPTTTAVETTVKGVDRLLSIREFTVTTTLGVGNFSEICIAQHKVTGEQFALKKLDKKQALDLAKRQHPNVHNEIAMECRVLLKRLKTPNSPQHPHIITMYHAFQDYNTLYYLMDLHQINLDLWSQLRGYKNNNCMVGTKSSQIKVWMMQLIDALEHFHSHGIVHRDIKPENILLNGKNHIIVIDLGTAKDLVMPDLNGPEFVGTPDFMSPEAVTGFSGKPDLTTRGATHTADLWALGAVLSLLHTGSTPFWSPSPYLAFLKIKRGLITRPWGIPDDDTYDLISQLLQVDPTKRLGHDCYQVQNCKVVTNKGYDVIRNHSYFQSIPHHPTKHHVIASLQDLCLFATAAMAQQDALDLDLCDRHPPGCGTAHDLTRLSDQQRRQVLHLLDKSKQFKEGDETRVLQRFYETPVSYIKAKVRTASRDFVGLTQMTDDEYKPPSARGSADPYAKKEPPTPTHMVVLSNPLFVKDHGLSGEEEKRQFQGLKACIAAINKQRPKVVIVPAQHTLSAKVWKLVARIRDSIQIVWADGSVHYTFWLNGFQGILLQRSELLQPDSTHTIWLREQMEQSRMAKPQLVCFCDCDPRDLPQRTLKQLARGNVLVLFGLLSTTSLTQMLDYTVDYEPNEVLEDDDDDDGDGGASVKSTDSVEDTDDASTMRVLGTSVNGMGWLTISESDPWSTYFEAIPLPE